MGRLQGFEGMGFVIVERVFDGADLSVLLDSLESQSVRSGRQGGVRNLLAVPEMLRLAESKRMVDLVVPIVGTNARVVRGTLFDKTSDANWKVPWHQDMTIAVASRLDVEGFGPWSVKANVVHVQPPARVLEEMVSLRLHLDDCPAQNGALRVMPGSHRLGKIDEREIAAHLERGDATVCEVGRGGVLLMRPLLLHASSAATVPGHRRVLHFDYAARDLPGGLRWAESVNPGDG